MACGRLTTALLFAMFATSCGPSEPAPPPIAETNSSIRAALDAGHPEQAAAIIADTPPDQWDSKTTNLKLETDDRLKDLMTADRSANLVDEVAHNQLPRLAGISVSPTKDPNVLMARLEVLEGAARYLAEVPSDGLSPAQAAERSRLKDAISNRQVELFPSFRASFASGLDARLWDQDVRVSAVGSRSSTIRFTGSMFVTNANVRPVQEANREAMQRLRVRRAEYRWHSGSETLSFTLSAPADAQIGFWEGQTFKAVN